MFIRVRIVLGLVILVTLSACSSSSSISVKMRSAVAAQASAARLATTSNTSFTLQSYKIPVQRVTLVGELKGTGYSSSCKDLYKCPYATDADCLVDLADSSNLDDLLKGNSTESQHSVSLQDENAGSHGSEMTCDGISIEWGVEHSSQVEGAGNGYLDVLVRGSVLIGGTIYYTNATSGLSTTGPAEDTKIRRGAGGVTTPLLTPVKSSDSFTVILYGDPKGAVMGTDNRDGVNSKCTASTPAVCTDDVAVFGTIDSGSPTIERYKMSPGGNSADVALTIVFDSAQNPFGAFMRHIYNNKVDEAKTIHGAANFSVVEKTADGTLNFKYYTDGSALGNVIANFSRGAHSNTILMLVNSPTSVTVTKE